MKFIKKLKNLSEVSQQLEKGDLPDIYTIDGIDSPFIHRRYVVAEYFLTRRLTCAEDLYSVPASERYDPTFIAHLGHTDYFSYISFMPSKVQCDGVVHNISYKDVSATMDGLEITGIEAFPRLEDYKFYTPGLHHIILYIDQDMTKEQLEYNIQVTFAQHGKISENGNVQYWGTMHEPLKRVWTVGFKENIYCNMEYYM